MMPHRPTVSLLSPHFKYIKAADTNVQATWKRFGWVPPTPPLRPQSQ